MRTWKRKKILTALASLSPKTLLVIEKPPFEVSETGWGEFDVIIKLHFHPVSGEKPQTLYHHLKLHPYEEDGLGIKSKPVTSYLYDEIVSRKNTSWGSWTAAFAFSSRIYATLTHLDQLFFWLGQN